MAIAFVRSITGSANFSTTLSLVLSGVAVGNKLIFAGAAWQEGNTSSAPSGVGSSPTATWRNDINGPIGFTGPGQGNQTYLWSADVGTAGTTTVTAAWPQASYPQAYLGEYSGLASGSASFDAIAGNEAQNLSTSPSAVGPTATTAQASELVIAVFGANSASNPSNLGLGTPSGYTNRFRDNDGFTFCAISVDEKIVSATGTQSASWAHGTGETGAWSGLIGTYKAGATATSAATQTATLVRPTQTAAGKGLIQATQSKTLSLVTQTATARQLGTVATQTFDRTNITFDSTLVTFDGGGVVATSSAAASQTALPVTQVSVAKLVAAATSAQTTTLATASMAAQASFGVVTTQSLLLATSSAAAVSSMSAQQARALTMPGQTATAVRLARASAAQTLLPPTLIASNTPVYRAQQTKTLPMLDQTAKARAVVPRRIVELEPEPTPVVVGSLDDMIARQSQILPPSWFGAPGLVPALLRLPLAMAGQIASWLHDLIGYARLQTRIKTATGGWLDIISWDFFGARIPRRAGQGDESFRTRILVEMFRPRGTRPAMADALRDLTGLQPRIFEPQRPADVGGIGIASGLGIGVSGAIGSLGSPGEVFIDVFRHPDAGIPLAAGIGSPSGGIGVPSRLVITSITDVVGAMRDEDVYAVVEATRPVGILTWVRISLGERPAA